MTDRHTTIPAVLGTCAAERANSPQSLPQAWHRSYVGGLWDEIGQLQFEFVIAQGLQPHHRLLDIACGSLRAGIHFIAFLEPSHYLGIDKNSDLIQAGINHELGPQMLETKQPKFVVSADFEFSEFGVRPEFALAQSLFTHLPPEHIIKCLRQLRPVIADAGVFFATFNECEQPVVNPTAAHDHHIFRYSHQQMQYFGQAAGWLVEYVGKWRHPRGQKMLVYRPR